MMEDQDQSITYSSGLLTMLAALPIGTKLSRRPHRNPLVQCIVCEQPDGVVVEIETSPDGHVVVRESRQ